jgi:hypothetical protein
VNRTKSEVAQFLDDFLHDRGGAWDWDDFTSIPIKDPALERIRLGCATLPERFPPAHCREYCNEEGRAEIEEFLKNLRDNKTHA